MQQMLEVLDSDELKHARPGFAAGSILVW